MSDLLADLQRAIELCKRERAANPEPPTYVVSDEVAVVRLRMRAQP